MLDPNSHSPLTLEDLLRLKKAERPSPEFWARFEQELRQKQLAALVERRPWWQTFSLNLSPSRSLIPLGATALIALLVAMNRTYTPTPAAQVDSGVFAVHTDSPVFESLGVAANPALGRDEPSVAMTLVGSTDAEIYRTPTAAPVVSLSEHLPERAVELTPWSSRSPVQSISARMNVGGSMPLTRVNLELPHPLADSPMQLATDRLQRSGGAGAELALVSALSSKRTRLLAQFSDRQFAPEPQAPASIRERLTRHLSDASFTEHFTRIGLKGDQVSLRF